MIYVVVVNVKDTRVDAKDVEEKEDNICWCIPQHPAPLSSRTVTASISLSAHVLVLYCGQPPKQQHALKRKKEKKKKGTKLLKS